MAMTTDKSAGGVVAVLFICLLFLFGSAYSAEESGLNNSVNDNIEIVTKGTEGATEIISDRDGEGVSVKINGKYVGNTPLYVKIKSRCIDGKDLVLEGDPSDHSPMTYTCAGCSSPHIDTQVFKCGDYAVPKLIFLNVMHHRFREPVGVASMIEKILKENDESFYNNHNPRRIIERDNNGTLHREIH